MFDRNAYDTLKEISAIAMSVDLENPVGAEEAIVRIQEILSRENGILESPHHVCNDCSLFRREDNGKFPVFDCPHMKGIKHWDVDRAAYCKHFSLSGKDK